MFFPHLFVCKKQQVLKAESGCDRGQNTDSFLFLWLSILFELLTAHPRGELFLASFIFWQPLKGTLLTFLLHQSALAVSEGLTLDGKGKVIGKGQAYSQIAELQGNREKCNVLKMGGHFHELRGSSIFPASKFQGLSHSVKLPVHLLECTGSYLTQISKRK